VRGADGGPDGLAAHDGVAGLLQAALLPPGLPVLPRVQVAARYLPAPAGQPAGGGWFDASALAGGVVALVAGEVPGGGAAASVAMGQLRTVLNELLATIPDLGSALARAEAFAARTPGLMATALAVAALDPSSGSVRYATCGHPPPLVVTADGGARFLDGGRSGPLGTGSAPVVTGAALGPGELLVLYSDALTALPARTPAGAASELASVAARAAAGRTLPADPDVIPADRVCRLLAELAAGSGHADDVTVLAAQRLPRPVPAFHLRLPARKGSLADARHRFGSWLADAAPLAAGQDALLLALGELVANAVEHAYAPGSEGSVDIRAQISENGLLECRVADDGRWREPGHAEDRGNGLMLAAYLGGEFLVNHAPQPARAPVGSRGTVVTLRRRLLRPAVVGPVPGGGARPAAAGGPSFRAEIPSAGHVVVHGSTGSVTAERFAGRLLAACRGGTIPLTVDLSDVTRLDSAAVQVLFQLRDRLAVHDRDLRLLVEPGSPAAPVLDLACLPYASVRVR
jgi:anti-sigma regulatory factor (Ser/Thr protein kinase)